MRRVIKWTLIVLVIVLVLGAIQTFRRLEEAGQFITLDKVTPGICRTISAPPGVEDLDLAPGRRYAFLSSDDRRAGLAGHGGIFRLDLDSIDTPSVELSGAGSGAPAIFHPHGISVWTGPDGQAVLMVVNHRGPMQSVTPSDHAVEIFDIIDQDGAPTLRHRRTVELAEFRSPNDLVATGPDSFYVTNIFGSDTATGVALEGFLGFHRSNLVWFDGQSARVVVDGLGLANGVDISPDGATIYVAETGARRLKAYARDAATGALTLMNDGFFGTGLDNINVADDGALWIGAHPRMIDFLGHASDPASLSPSQVLRVEPQAGGAARTLYTDHGSEISGVSAAIERDGVIVAGAVFEPRLLVCQWTETPGAKASP